MSENANQLEAQRLSAQDALFVYTETESFGMHIMGTLILDPSDLPEGSFGYQEILETIESRLHLMPPFRQRLMEIPGGLGHPILVDDPDFAIEDHMHHIAVPAPGTLRELALIVGDVASRPLRRTKPLWEMWVVEGMQGGQIALVMKMHHSTVDGASGSSMMGNLLQLSPDAEPAEPPSKEWDPPPLPSALDLMRRSLTSQLVNPLWLGGLIVKTVSGLRNRQAALEEVTEEGKEPMGLFGGAPLTGLNRAISARRSVAYGSAPLADLKQIKNAFGVTVNDAVLAAACISLRRYLEARDDLPDRPLVCMVPVSTKTDEEKSELSNKVSSLIIQLPTHLDSPEEVIDAVHRETAAAKHVFASIEDDLLPEWLKLVPPIVASVGADLYSGYKLADGVESPMANVVVSNMMGPPVPLYFGGARVEAVFPMGPIADTLAMNITLLSNMGRFDIGVLACPDNAPDIWEITEGFAQAVAELKIAAEKRTSPDE